MRAKTQKQTPRTKEHTLPKIEPPPQLYESPRSAVKSLEIWALNPKPYTWGYELRDLGLGDLRCSGGRRLSSLTTDLGSRLLRFRDIVLGFRVWGLGAWGLGV